MVPRNSKQTRPVAGPWRVIQALVWALTLSTAAAAADPPAEPDASVRAGHTTASRLLGSTVTGTGSTRIGEVADLLVSIESGDISAVLIRLDPGVAEDARLIRIPFTQVTFGGDGPISVALDREEAAAAPAYDRSVPRSDETDRPSPPRADAR